MLKFAYGTGSSQERGVLMWLSGACLDQLWYSSGQRVPHHSNNPSSKPAEVYTGFTVKFSWKRKKN